MKKQYLKYVLILSAAIFLASCKEDGLDPTSVITVDSREYNEFDEWLEANYMEPYNIEFKYRYEMNETNYNYYTIPAEYKFAVQMAHLVKYLCIDTYDEVAGITFTRSYFPKLFVLMGEWEYLNNGTYILGTAEGGKKIILTGINWLPTYIRTADNLNEYYIKTIHHEFTHILNQNVDYPKDFAMVTADSYLADSWSSEPYKSSHLKRGFITDYAQESDTEDFAEMLSTFVTHDAAWWDSQLLLAGDGAASISAKLDIVKAYMQDAFGINLERVRDVVLRRQNDVMTGLVDLNDLTID
ncbi:MAG: putative zinc-binding metallopeptidase [Bacteroidales bacterium]|nr:putative zinc-binding metallopeptidase [Bacteroidales bacterium]